jgi:uncharacterized Ntn-hydrolase superfamily protein
MNRLNVRTIRVVWFGMLILIPRLFMGVESPPPAPLRPVATYSIVAFDPDSGQMGVAVQSHWFSVGSLVIWAEAGIGAIATQSFVEPSYGPLGLQLLRAGKDARASLSALLSVDPHAAVRQVAMVDARGAVAVHTGEKCIAQAGHRQGQNYSCQANMMENNTVWAAMATAYESTRGELVDRLLAALLAAEKEGGDIRGRQSAAILVVSDKASGTPWKNRVFDLRVEDHPQPLQELQRLITIAKAYNHMNKGDDLLTENNVQGALAEYATAMGIYPGNPEMIFWPAVTMAASGQVDRSLPLFKKVFAMDRRWAELLKRLPAVNQFPDDPTLLNKIMALLPEAKKRK